MEPSNLKLYIAVREEVPAHMVPVCVAHAVLVADEAYVEHEDLAVRERYSLWKDLSFKKVVLSVNDKEWRKIKSQVPFTTHSHENTTLNGEPCVLIPVPQWENPNVLKFAKMWKPNESK